MYAGSSGRSPMTVVDSRYFGSDLVAVDALVEVSRSASESGGEIEILRRFTVSALLQRAAGSWQVGLLRVHQAQAAMP